MAVLAAQTADPALVCLLQALPIDGGARLAAVRAVFEREQRERPARETLFAPLRPPVPANRNGEPVGLSSSAALALWRLAQAERGEDCDALIAAEPSAAAAEAAIARRDALCCELATLLARPRTPAAAEAMQTLEAQAVDVDAVVALLAIAPQVRAALPRLGAWTHHLTQQSAAEIRARYAAAGEEGDAGALFIEALAAHLPEPWHALRLIALILDRPTDAVLATGPLAPLIERLIVRIERAVEAARSFDPEAGRQEGRRLGQQVREAVLTLGEFDQWVETSRSSAWGGRLATSRRALAVGVEAQLKAAPRLLAAALPTRAPGWTQRNGPRAPVLTHDPDPRAAVRAESSAALLAELRTTPSSSGFAAPRAKATQQAQEELDGYVEAALDLLHRADPDQRERLAAYLAVAARVAGALGGEPAGMIVRRRAAAAGAVAPERKTG